MSYPTKEQWAELELEMSHAYGRAHLMVDGYKLSLQVAKGKGLKYDIVWYANGKFEGAWLMKDSEEGRRFARPVSFSAYKPNDIKKIERDFGKRRVLELFPNLYKKGVYLTWSWPSQARPAAPT